ncbi:alkane hydroxylase MAH1-like isoform X2 [Prosopis cineraria]|uniref:alkane hydroxylase MAH1-like isoform X2 n=1 Tax=Prosopis cineraria TaxID=364024 RepID=UPI002410404C|nr:alkane hydroxylase MAH1-like isoform X2 [Prosopis cineraria]
MFDEGDEGKDDADDKILRDIAFSLLFAGRDTITSALTWFFWLVATHPSVEAKIHEEIKEEKEVKDQVYLHAALCERLRLYPPVPLVLRQTIKHDILPSGHERRCYKDPLLKDRPIFGMLPPALSNLGQIHDYMTQALQRKEGTGSFVGPWFTGMNGLVTCNPMNVHHMMSKNFANYIKGPEFHEIFEPFGEGIFTADSDTWKYHRALLHSLFKTPSFEKFLEKIVREKVDFCLSPLLDHLERQGIEVDLQDVFNRFNFDIIFSMVLGSDPKSLAVDFPKVTCERAFNEAEEFIFYRYSVPRCIWKLQRWLRVGAEKKMAEVCQLFDQFLYESIASKREELRKNNEMKKTEEDLLTTLMREEQGRDTITSALTWFFWLVATHPSVEAKILEETKEEKEMKHQVYLHGALCESLRLFPPIPFEHKQATKHDSLPSGHEVYPGTMIFLSLYAMGR